MIELIKIQNIHKLDLLLTKYKYSFNENKFMNNDTLKIEFKIIQSYIQSRYTIDSLVKKRYIYLKNNNIDDSQFYNLSIFNKNVLEIYMNVKFCNYYKNIILTQWNKYELIINYLNNKK